jgi:hypothetical protein
VDDNHLERAICTSSVALLVNEESDLTMSRCKMMPKCVDHRCREDRIEQKERMEKWK